MGTSIRTIALLAAASLMALLSPTAYGADLPGPLDGPGGDLLPGPVINCRTIDPAPYADLSNCELGGADLSGANLSYANLTNANLANADLSDAILLGVTAPGVRLSQANLIGTNLLDADLTGGQLRGANLRNANLTSASMSGADLDGAVLSGAQLAGAMLADADMAGAIVDGATFANADLTRVDAHNVDFTASTLSGALLTGADLVGANLTKANLSGMMLTRADLTGAVLKQARLVDTSLSGANLTDATLLGADLTRAGLDKVTWWNTTCPDGAVTTGAPCRLVRESNEASFFRVGPISYRFHKSFTVFTKDFDYTTTPANLFYTFQPVDSDAVDPVNAPVFVMLNGGPGAATTANLFANNTARYTENIDAVGAQNPGFVSNPNSWTKFGNLLYIDPPQTGFSYNIDGKAANNDLERVKEYLLRGNFNSFIDADQVLRVLLGFLDSHPDLQDNPVVLVGESYGGTRVSTMLNMLLFSGRYDADGPSMFRDPSMVAAIRRHFTDVAVTGPLTPQVVAQQFGRQLLIQPQLTSYQSDVQTSMFWKTKPSVIDAVAAETGNAFSRDTSKCTFPLNFDLGACALMKYVDAWNRDRYNWKRPADWTDNQEAFTSAQFNQVGKLNTILGVDVATIEGFPAKERVNAYHLLTGLLGVEPDGIGGLPDGIDAADQAAAWAKAIDDGFVPGPYFDAITAAQQAANAAVGDIPGNDSLASHFGKLGRYDRYFMAWNPEVYLAYAANVIAPEYVWLPIRADSDPTYGAMFLENARYVETFLTDAEYDLVIYSPAMPDALKGHKGIVKEVTRTRASGDGSGTFQIDYRDGNRVNLYYPYYGTSGHAVAATQPAKLASDVAAWLRCTADGTCHGARSD